MRPARRPVRALELRATVLRDVVLPDLRVAVARPHRDPELERVFVRVLDELAAVENSLGALRQASEPSAGARTAGRSADRAPRGSAAWRALRRRTRRRAAPEADGF